MSLLGATRHNLQSALDLLHLIYLRALNEMEAKPLATTEKGGAPFFSPDGQWVGFVSRSGPKLMKVSVTGGAPQTITERFVLSADWGVHGDLVVSLGDGLGRVSSEGGEIEQLTSVDRAGRELGHRLPQWLPGGESVLFTIGTGDMTSWDDALIAVLSLSTGRYHVVLEGGTHARYSETGHLVYVRGGSLYAAPFDLAEREVTGPSFPVLDGVTIDPGGWGTGDFSLSKSGSLVYAHGGSLEYHGRVWWVDRDGDADVLIDEDGAFHLPRISPDGRWVTLGRRGSNPSVWVYDVSRTTLSRLAHGFVNNFPIWTPDGRRVTFFSSADGRIPGNIFWQTADGSLPAEQLLPPDYTGRMLFPVSWSPDGKTLAFERHRPETQYDIMLLSLEGDRTVTPFLQSEFDEDKPNFSPDGRWMAYVSNETGRYEVYVRPFPASTGKWLVSTDGGDFPRWNPKGRELFYRNGDKLMLVDVGTQKGQLTLGSPRVLFETALDADFDVAPDGEHFLMADRRPSPPTVTQLNLILNWAEELKRLVPTDN